MGFTLMISFLSNGKKPARDLWLNQQHMSVFYSKSISDGHIKRKKIN